MHSPLLERDTALSQQDQGCSRKYDVRRVDGEGASGESHGDCPYFVIDLNHDDFAEPMMQFYALLVSSPDLAADLLNRYGKGKWPHNTTAMASALRTIADCSQEWRGLLRVAATEIESTDLQRRKAEEAAKIAEKKLVDGIQAEAQAELARSIRSKNFRPGDVIVSSDCYPCAGIDVGQEGMAISCYALTTEEATNRRDIVLAAISEYEDKHGSIK